MDFIYLSQVVQGLCIKAEAEHYRRLLSEEGAYTRGTLYWQLNDIWQAQSWASVQYDLSWKVLHHYMKTVYQSVAVSAYQYEGYIGVYVVNDMPPSSSFEYTLVVQAVSWQTGKVINVFPVLGTSKGFTGVKVLQEKPAALFNGTTITESFLYLVLNHTKNNTRLATNWFFPSNFSAVKLLNPKIQAAEFKQRDTSTVSFVLSSEAVAPFVYLQTVNLTGNFNDNGFLMLPATNYTLSFSGQNAFSVLDLEKELLIRSIFDTYN